MSDDDDDAPAMPVPEHGLPAGTPVLTPSGEQPVEALALGGLVIAVSGQGAPFQRILEIRRAVVPAALVRLRAGALAEGAPREDLLLPTGQALLVDGVLVQAGALLGGPGAVLEQQAGLCEVFSIVLAGHDAVLAAGTPVETAPPGLDVPAFAPRTGAEAWLRARLAWRAEAMGWAEALPDDAAAPGLDLAEELASSALAPALPPSPFAGPGA